MSWSSRLARLPAAAPATPSPVAVAPSVADPRRAALEELQRKMQELREGAPSPEPAEQELPFVCEQGVWVHRRRIAEDERIGHVPASTALRADAETLALLGLDASLASCNFEEALYLDTETTGLSQAAGTVPFLVGMLRTHRGEAELEQLLVKNLDEERPLLERVAAHLEAASVLITFNGKTFDIPLLKSRFVLARMPVPKIPPHLDLLHVARRIHRNLASIKLTALEIELLGVTRGDDIPGAEIPAVYFHYLRTGQAATLRTVVDHNAWDVMAMAALVGLYGQPLGGEPSVALPVHALPDVARTLLRAGQVQAASRVADHAVARGGQRSALLARASIAKVLRQRDAALADLEAALGAPESLPEEAPPSSARQHQHRDRERRQMHLELCKLYEHHAQAFDKALQVAELGTGESPERALARRQRLQRKHAKTGVMPPRQ